MTRGKPIPLSEVGVHSAARVVQLCGPDDSVNQKLQDLGLFRGIVVKVLSCNPGMPMLLAIGDGRAALARELAIYVKVIVIA